MVPSNSWQVARHGLLQSAGLTKLNDLHNPPCLVGYDMPPQKKYKAVFMLELRSLGDPEDFYIHANMLLT